MTLQQAKDHVLNQLILTRGPIALRDLCSRLGVRCSSNGRYSKRAYALYNLYGRALQALKKERKADYTTKAAGGPGWIRT